MHTHACIHTDAHVRTKGRQWADRHWGLVWGREEVICLIICSVYSRIQCKRLTSLDTGETGGEWKLLTPGLGWIHIDGRSVCVQQFIHWNPVFSQEFHYWQHLLWFWVNWPRPCLACRQLQMHSAHAHTYNHAHRHTLPDLAYKKMCLWTEKICRWFSHIHKHTRTPGRSSAGPSCDMHNLKQQETCIASPCQTGTVLHGFIVLYFNNATSFHSNLIFFLFKTQYSLIVCSALCTNQKMVPKIPYFVLFRVKRLCNLLLATKLQYFIKEREIILHPKKKGLKEAKRGFLLSFPFRWMCVFVRNYRSFWPSHGCQQDRMWDTRSQSSSFLHQ